MSIMLALELLKKYRDRRTLTFPLNVYALPFRPQQLFRHLERVRQRFEYAPYDSVDSRIGMWAGAVWQAGGDAAQSLP